MDLYHYVHISNMACKWFSTALCLILSAAIVSSQLCEVTLNGKLIGEDDWAFPQAGNAILDTAETNTQVDVITTKYVTAVTLEVFSEVLSAAYLDMQVDLSNVEAGAITTFVHSNFTDYETNEFDTTLRNQLVFTCSDTTTKELRITNEITFSNNHMPQFENLNAADGYTYKLPMPFPKGISISTAYNEIYAFDVDIGNTGVTFSITGENSELFIVSNGETDVTSDLKPRYYAELEAHQQLYLTEGFSFTITATDNEQPTQSTTTKIYIEIDAENTEPPVVQPDVFNSVLYTTSLDETSVVGNPLVTNPADILLEGTATGEVTIKVLDMPAGDTISSLIGAAYDDASKEVTLNLLRPLTTEELVWEDYIVKIQATITNAGQTVAESVVHVDIINKVVVPEGSFDSSLYTATIADMEVPINTDLPTNPVTIQILEPPSGALSLQLLQPYDGAPWEDGQFTPMDKGAGVITVRLAKPLTVELLQQYRSITAKLTAVESTVEFAAETLVQFDLPLAPAQQELSFINNYYTSDIPDPAFPPGPLTTFPDAITLTAFTISTTVVTIEPPSTGQYFDDLFTVSLPDANGVVIVSLARELTPVELAYESLTIVLVALDSTSGTSAHTIVEVNIPTVPVIPVPSFKQLLYTSVITNPEMSPGVLTTSPEVIEIENYVEGVTTEITQPSTGTYIEGQFKIVQTDATVTLELAQTLSPEALAYEFLFIQIDAKQGGLTISNTIVQIDIPLTDATNPPPEPTFNSIFYTGALPGSNTAGAMVNTNEPIAITNFPTETFELTVEDAPGVNPYAKYYTATYAGSGNVDLSLKTPVDTDGLNTEVHVIALRGVTSGMIAFETLVQVDMPAIVVPPVGDPGTFSSIIYTTEVLDPEQTGILPTHLPITINSPPDDVVVNLIPAAAGTPSYTEFFGVSQPDANGVIVFSQTQVLTAEVLENLYLIMIIEATSASQTDYRGETVVHVKLPEHVCPIPETTTCPAWVSCPPCLCTTQPPASEVTFQQPSYSYSGVGGNEPDPSAALFQVVALYNGQQDTFVYSLVASDYLLSSLSINAATGEVFQTVALPPGSFNFYVQAVHGSGAQNRVAAYIHMQPATECDDTIYFEYPLVSMAVNEEESMQLLPPNINSLTCTYSKIVDPIEAEDWFILDENTGELSITDASNIEAFDGDTSPSLTVTITAACPSTPAQKRSVRDQLTRNQMIVVVTLIDVNDNVPVFDEHVYVVGYPILGLAQQILPGPIASITAKDADVNEVLRYSLAEVNPKFEVRSDTASLYPVNGVYNYQDETVVVAVFDRNDRSDAINYNIKHVSDEQIAVATIEGAVMEDVDTIMSYINDQLTIYSWRYFKSALLVDEPASKTHSTAIQQRINRSSARAASGGLFLVLYAFNADNTPVSYDDLNRELNKIDDQDWTISSIETWEEAGGGFGNGIEVNESYKAATIALGVITGLLLIVIIVLIYLTVFRKKQIEKKSAKSGFKNRTSFSNQAGHVEGGRKHSQNGLHPGWIDDAANHNDTDSRKLSVVKFNDEPEVIPRETARL